MNQDRVDNYNEHAIFMADIASAIMSGNSAVLDINGVKEIISLYLLIPYMTSGQLKTPGNGYVIPKLSGTFVDDILIEDLRNTICHSFVSVEEDKGDDVHGKYLIFDDRIVIEKSVHSRLEHHSGAYSISINKIRNRLVEMIEVVRNSN